MKLPTRGIILLLFLAAGIYAQAQPKYYRMKEKIPGTASNWRDTLFVVKVSDPAIQAQFDAELSLPWSSRTKIVNGTVKAGDGGFNKNGSHCFSWHHEDQTVQLTDLTTEVCDGWPYADCELADFVNNPGFFCPWSMNVWDEITNPEGCSLSVKDPAYKVNVNLYPNPIRDKIKISISGISYNKVVLEVYNSLGVLVYSDVIKGPDIEVDLSTLSTGAYHCRIHIDDIIVNKLIVKE